ncbi:hypothetical protein OCAR_4744 [Afipia carboxidovorans OM5]|nr:hypothetical protein OCAR_4744 [Afipia carboxidovorans OM5]
MRPAPPKKLIVSWISFRPLQASARAADEPQVSGRRPMNYGRVKPGRAAA